MVVLALLSKVFGKHRFCRDSGTVVWLPLSHQIEAIVHTGGLVKE